MASRPTLVFFACVAALCAPACSRGAADKPAASGPAAATPGSAPGGQPSWRLPRGIVPEHYTLKVTPDLAKATFAGEESIDVRVEQPTDRIVLNAAEITFDSVTVEAGGTKQAARVALDEKTEMATLTVPKAIAAGPATLRITYAGRLKDQLRGFYLSKTEKRRDAVTQLQATDARRMFPSFDEPAMKATFDLTAVIDSGDHAIAN